MVAALLTGSSQITEGMTTAITTAGDNLLASVQDVAGTVLPIAMGIIGFVMAITIGIKLFKKLTGKA